MKKSTKVKLAVASVPALTVLYALASMPGGLMLLLRPVKTVRSMRQPVKTSNLFEQLDRATLTQDQVSDLQTGSVPRSTLPGHWLDAHFPVSDQPMNGFGYPAEHVPHA